MKTVTVLGQEVPAAKLLAALFNQSSPRGMGFVAARRGPSTLSEARAQKILDDRGVFHFDYLFGRPLKIKPMTQNVLTPDDEQLYDRDNGQGAFARAVEKALG